MKPNALAIERLFETAEKDGRDTLLEPEVYRVLELSGIKAPKRLFLPAGQRAGAADLAPFRRERIVVKIVSPLIVHKSDVGGVAFVPATARAVNAACDLMMRRVPGRYAAWARQRGMDSPVATSPRSVRESIRGFLVCEHVSYQNAGFGSELLVGVRNSRDFGPILTVGGGGLDVEYMSGHLKDGHGALLASAHLASDASLPALLEPLAVFGKLCAGFRGRKPLLSADKLVRTALRFRDLAAMFSPLTGASPFVIEEAEVNPFVVGASGLVPLDGLCRFSRLKASSAPRPPEGIATLLRPASIGIIGVSEKMNIGHIILNNILKNGFPKERIFVVKPGLEEIEGCRCVPSVRDLGEPVDLFVLTLAADQCYDVMQDRAGHEKARSVIIIAGGMGEKEGGGGIEAAIRELLEDGRGRGRLTPVVNGGNCLGIYSKPGRYDTTFIPEYKLPRPKSRDSGLALVSQSGAFMICRMSKLPGIEPVYAISLGNQLDLTVSDYLDRLKDDPAIRILAVYMEGFRPWDGLAFAAAVKDITADGRRSVLVYKAGRSPEGRAATSSHTASVAGEYGIFRSVLEQAGAIVAGSLFEFESFMKALVFLEGKRVRGPRVGLMSNAGFECVVLADNLTNGTSLGLAPFRGTTACRMASVLGPLGIDRLQDIHNPLDVTPVADDGVFSECARAILEDPGVDAAVVSNVPMTPAERTLPAGPGHSEDFLSAGSFARRIVDIFRSTEKPLVVNIDAGELYSPLADFLESEGVPVFRLADQAVGFLRSFVGHKLKTTDGR